MSPRKNASGISSIEQVRRYLNWCYAAGKPATWSLFHYQYSHITKKCFKHGNSTWREIHKNYPAAIHWFNEIRLNKPRFDENNETEQIFNYLNGKYSNSVQIKWNEFKELHPKISQKRFYAVMYVWRKDHNNDPEAIKWFNEIRLNNNAIKVRNYYDLCFIDGTPASWKDFHPKHPNIKKDVFNNGKRSWRKNNENYPAAIQWFNEVRLNRDRQRVIRYLDWKYAEKSSALLEEFHEKYPRVSNDLFYNGLYTWRDKHADDPDVVIWLNEVRKNPSKVKRVVNWLDQQASAKEPAWYWLFHQQNPDINDDDFQNGKKSWKMQYLNDKNALDWLDSFQTESVFTSRIGHLFEKCVVSSIYAALRIKHIPMYYNTSNFADSGHSLGKYNRKAKRVEIRLITQDLLGSSGNIGNTLKDFLDANQKPHVAIDITIGTEYGKKINKYTDNITNLLIVTLSGTKSQRQLESNVRVLSIRDFIGSKWMNLDLATRVALERDINNCLKALREGPDSTSFREFKLNANRKWNEVCEEIKILGSQADYQTRVADDVEKNLKQGNESKELMAWVETARAAGHPELANRTEGLAQVVVALARRTKIEDALRTIREYPRYHPECLDNSVLPPDIRADIDFLKSLSHDATLKEEVEAKGAKDLLQKIEADIDYLDALGRGEAPGNDETLEESPWEEQDQSVDFEFPSNVDGAGDASEENSSDNEDREDSEDSPDKYL